MLFGNTKIIIYIGKDRVIVGDCRSAEPTFFEIKYEGDLPEVFAKIKERLPSSSYKIILSREISYTVKLDKLDKLKDRTIVKEELAKYIPEDFENDQFDWKLTTDDTVEAIVIKSNTYHDIQKIRSKYPDVRLETQSSISLLWEMGKSEDDDEVQSDIFIYAANRGKEKGGDNMVLNVEVVGEEPVKAEESIVMPVKNKWPLIGGFIFLIILVGGLGWYFMTKQQKQVVQTPSPTATPAPTSAPVVEKAPADFKLLIQNGTGTAGLAGSYKTKLAKLGFTQIETGNADSPATTTQIIVKEALPDSVQKIILETLSPLKPDITISPADSSTSSSDIVIILGTK